MLDIKINSPITRKVFNLTVPHDSMRMRVTAKADSLFDFDAYFNNYDQWVKAEITQTALADARNNVQTINMYDNELYHRKKYLNRYSMERHRKYTLSLAVIIFFFIGAPLGAIIRKGGLGMPVVVSILLFIAYYVVSMTGEKSAREDVWGMITGMWFSTLIFLPVGVWLTYKAANDATLMSADTYTKFLENFSFQKIGRILRKMAGMKSKELTIRL
jgi:lipopolysaccharide export system permease protein